VSRSHSNDCDSLSDFSLGCTLRASFIGQRVDGIWKPAGSVEGKQHQHLGLCW
jgi:hypothetical protein